MKIGLIRRKLFASFDPTVALCTALLCIAGLVVVYSAGYLPETQKSPAMERQAASMALGAVAFIVASLFGVGFWRQLSPVLYLANVLALAGVMFVGISAGGAQRWVEVAGFRMQPSEFMKLSMILLLARLFSSESARNVKHTLPTLLFPLLLIGVAVGLIIKQPDLGTGLCVLLISASTILLAGVHSRTLFRVALLALVAAYPAWHMLHDYQRNRILTFLSPERDPLGTGYHAMQSRIAVGSGAVTGKGFLEGTQTQLRFLPEQTTDFIFSVLAEEWGFIGSLLVVTIYGLLIYRLLAIAARCTDRFPAYTVFGVAALVFWQMTINVGMVIGILPVVGITLPLLSYGGSSVLTIMTALGIASGIGARRTMFS